MGKLTRETTLSKIFLRSLTLRKYIGLFLASLMILSCGGYAVRGDRPRGIYHRVKSGETLSIIARAYHVDLQELAEINNIDNPNRIEADGVIFIPDAQQVLDDIMITGQSLPSPIHTPIPPPASPREDKASTAMPKAVSKQESPKPETPNREQAQPRKRQEAPPAPAAVRDAEPSGAADRDSAIRRTPAKQEKEEMAGTSPKPDSRESAGQPVRPAENDGRADQIHFEKKRFIWPVKGRVVGKFGAEFVSADQSGKKIETVKIMNNGIRIAAGGGTAVVAAADGKVAYSMMIEKFGNTIIVEHDDSFKTVYYDLGKRLVENLQTVKKGQPIAYMVEMKTPKGEAIMSFEIRQQNKARNPLFFLP
jgi:murein DD-endopeptidase MepM/ murein hydrolase activator NlpD